MGGKTDPLILERNRRWREANPNYMKEYSARRRAEPGWKRARHLWQRYGLTLDEWDAKLIEQCGRCDLCGEPLDDKIEVDHNHKTGRVRGLLHSACNNKLSPLEDVVYLNAAIDYLVRWAS